jgi:hypothetical protein
MSQYFRMWRRLVRPVYRRFGRLYCFYFQGQELRQASDQEACNIQSDINVELMKGKVLLSLQQTVEVHRVVRRRGSHIFQRVGSQMAVRLSVLRAGRPHFISRKFPGTHIC